MLLKIILRHGQISNFIMIKQLEMNSIYIITQKLMVLFTILIMVGCGDNNKATQEAALEETESEMVKEAMLSAQQFKALGMEIDTLQKRNLEGFITANGRLEVPPQYEAVVTSVFG